MVIACNLGQPRTLHGNTILCEPAKNITWGYHAVWASLEHFIGKACSLGQPRTLHGDDMHYGSAKINI